MIMSRLLLRLRVPGFLTTPVYSPHRGADDLIASDLPRPELWLLDQTSLLKGLDNPEKVTGVDTDPPCKSNKVVLSISVSEHAHHRPHFRANVTPAQGGIK